MASEARQVIPASRPMVAPLGTEQFQRVTKTTVSVTGQATERAHPRRASMPESRHLWRAR
jgi:hypothetical protein